MKVYYYCNYLVIVQRKPTTRYSTKRLTVVISWFIQLLSPLLHLLSFLVAKLCKSVSKACDIWWFNAGFINSNYKATFCI